MILSPLLARALSPALLFSLSSLLVLGEFWVAPYPLSPPDTPAFYAQLRDLPDAGAVLNLPMNYDRPGYLLYQTVHHKPLTIGYISRDDPRTLTERAPVLQHFRQLGPDILDFDPAMVGMTVLHDLGVSFVIEDRYKMPGGEERIYTEGLAKAIFANQQPLFQDDRLTVHHVQAPAQPLPYLVLGEFNWGPLQVDKTGERRRALSAQPALIYFHHVPKGAQLRIAYRTTPSSGLQVVTSGSLTPVATLPPAPAGNISLIDLHKLAATVQGVALLADAPAGVQIEKIGLVLP